MCFNLRPHPAALYGTWIVGWGGGMDHFSYFRIAPDGTVRRGSYEPAGAWADDIPSDLPCWPDVAPFPSPLVGVWEPAPSSSEHLGINLWLSLPCDPGAGYTERWFASVSADGRSASLDGDASSWEAYRQDPDQCAPDFGVCEVPEYPWP